MSATEVRKKETIKKRIYWRSADDIRALVHRELRTGDLKKKSRKVEKRKENALSSLVSAQSGGEARTARDRCGLRSGCPSSLLGNTGEVSVRTLKNLREDDGGGTRCLCGYRFPRILLVTFSFACVSRTSSLQRGESRDVPSLERRIIKANHL